MNIQQFCETAEVYGVNSSIWLVDGDEMLATHCSDTTYSLNRWDDVTPPTRKAFLEFLADENWTHVANEYPQFKS